MKPRTAVILGMLVIAAVVDATVAHGEEADPAHSPRQVPVTLTALMPQPRSVDWGDGWLQVKEGFLVEWLGYRSSMLDRAVLRFHNDIARRTGLDVGRAGATRLRIDCRADDSAYLTIDARERYSLAVKPDVIALTADGPAGVLRGLATLRQSITNRPEGFAIPEMLIEDGPRFVWRGVMIDVVRHFMSLSTLKRQIDAMELVKLNVLHLHLSDNEGFRVESRLYPKLCEVSSQGLFYSQPEIQELVSYAADRGVRIVPEFDVPGHSLAILKAYPEYASGVVEGRDYFSAMGSALNPAKPETFAFLDRLFGEMAALFGDQYFHVGGDEISGADWAANRQVQDFMKSNSLKTKQELESYLFARVRKTVRAHGKAVIGWEEVGRTAIPDDVIVQTWRSSSAIARVTAKGNRVIVSGGYYFPAENYYGIDPLDPAAYGRTREQVAEAKAKKLPGILVAEEALIDPALTLSPPQEKLVLGGEGCVWTEIITDEMLDGRLWPAPPASGEGRVREKTREPDTALSLKANLASWRDNHDRFAAIARGKPKLEVALPISADIAALARIGLDAMDAIESGRPPDAHWQRRAQEVLDRQAAAEKASESIIKVVTMSQPPADLLINITPGVKTLVKAAISVQP